MNEKEAVNILKRELLLGLGTFIVSLTALKEDELEEVFDKYIEAMESVNSENAKLMTPIVIELLDDMKKFSKKAQSLPVVEKDEGVDYSRLN